MLEIFEWFSNDTKLKWLDLALWKGGAMQNSVLYAILLGTIFHVKLVL